jgi:hypothetical protein
MRSRRAPPGTFTGGQRKRTRGKSSSASSSLFRSIVDGCTPPIRCWRAHHTPNTCPARPPWRGAQSFARDVGNGRRMEARQGAIRVFFGTPIVCRSAPQPAIRLRLLRDPVNRPNSPPRRERAGHLARRNFERSRSRCSWNPGPVRFRPASLLPRSAKTVNKNCGLTRREQRERRTSVPLFPLFPPCEIIPFLDLYQIRRMMGDRGLPQKNSHGPSLRQHHPADPTFHAKSPTRNEEVPGSALGMPPDERRNAVPLPLSLEQRAAEGSPIPSAAHQFLRVMRFPVPFLVRSRIRAPSPSATRGSRRGPRRR